MSDGRADRQQGLPDIPGTLTTNDRIRVQDLAALTPERVAEYLLGWDALFR